jgi:hypothetical protein
MKRLLLIGLPLAAMLFAQQVQPGKSAAADSKDADIKAQITDLTARVEKLRDQSDQHYFEIEELKRPYEYADFDTASPGTYSRVNTAVGPMLLSIGKIEPYLDGFKVQVQIGNVLSVAFSGFELETMWGPRFKPADTSDYLKWANSQQKKTLSLTEVLLPNRWTKVDVMLPSTEAKDFGHLQLKINISKIIMPGLQ